MDRVKVSKLNWDSEFFGYKVGKIEIDNKEQSSLLSTLESKIGSDYNLIYLFSKEALEFPESTSYEMLLTDIKRSYIFRVNSEPSIFYDKVKVVDFERDAALLYELGYQSGCCSRYNVDPHISSDDFKRFYRKWIDNSVNRSFADYVYVAEDHDEIIGFVAARVVDKYLSVSLIATDTSRRGKGVGTALMHAVIRKAIEKGLNVEVTTQKDNKVACYFYEKLGFSLQSETYVYHIWCKKYII